MSGRDVVEAELLDEPVAEEAVVLPPPRLVHAVTTIERLVEKYRVAPDGPMRYRVTGPVRNKEAAQRTAGKLREAIRWMMKHKLLERPVSVTTDPTQGETRRHPQQGYGFSISNPHEYCPWAVFLSFSEPEAHQGS